MRITTQMTHSKAAYYLSKNYALYSKLGEQVSAERQVLNLSDNPSSAITGIRIAATIAKTNQYISNIQSAEGSLKIVDTQLTTAKSTLDDIKNLITGAANGTYSATERQVMAGELGDMLKQLLTSANATDGERFIFGGTNSTSQPYSTVGSYILYSGNDEKINISTGLNSTTAINCTGTSAFGSATSSVATDSLSATLNMSTDISTAISALNGGAGAALGKITITYSAYPKGLEVDLSGCDTVEDIKDCIERATYEASQNLDPKSCDWLDDSTLDWKDLADRYVQVTLNPDGTGFSLREIDSGEPLPERTATEIKNGLYYSGQLPPNSATDPDDYSGFVPGRYGLATVVDEPTPGNFVYASTGPEATYDKTSDPYYTVLSVDDYAGNRVATQLGIRGAANKYDSSNPDAVMDGYIHGTDLNPVITKSTLLADLEGYNDVVYTIKNGSQLNAVTITETSSDKNNVFNDWNLNNLSAGYNTGKNGELYARITRIGTAPDEEFYVELYAAPLDKAKASDLVASGTCGLDGGTLELKEANDSGVSGTVGIVPNATLVSGVDASASVDLSVNFGDGFQAVIDVPAFVEEKNAQGTSADYLDILSGWSITGLNKPSAGDIDTNGGNIDSQPASTDALGNVTVGMEYLYDEDSLSPTYGFITGVQVNLVNPDTGATVATGRLAYDPSYDPNDPAAANTLQSGRVAITGAEGFEQISGSVYIEIPAGFDLADSANDAYSGGFDLTATFATVEDLMRAVQESGAYTTLSIASDGKSLEFTSNLAGAYLTIAEDHDCYEQMGDVYQQLSGLDLNGLVAGVNADSNGAVYTEIAYYPPDPARTDGMAVLMADDGTQILIEAGYYVRVYSDSDALDVDYKDRDNSSLVAEGFLAYDSLPEGSLENLLLSSKNDSGVSGIVNLDYYGDRPVDTTAADYNNSNITVNPGGIRPSDTSHVTMQEVDVSGFTAGVHADYAGNSHGVVSYDAGSDTTTVKLYRDSSHTHQVASGVIDGMTGTVTFYETDKNGNFSIDIAALTADGFTTADLPGMTDAQKRQYYIPLGSMEIAENNLTGVGAGAQNEFTLSTGGLGASGQDREQNIYSTIIDAIAALNSNDVDALHNLIDTFQADIDRLLSAVGDIGSRASQMDLLADRYQEDLISYEEVRASTVGMDVDSMQLVILQYTSAQNAYNASLQVAGQYLQQSLLDYL